MVCLINFPKFCSLADYYSELWLIVLRGRLNHFCDNLSFLKTVCSFYCTTVVSVLYYHKLYFKNCISHTSRHCSITVYLEWIPWEISATGISITTIGHYGLHRCWRWMLETKWAIGDSSDCYCHHHTPQFRI